MRCVIEGFIVEICLRVEGIGRVIKLVKNFERKFVFVIFEK